MIWLGVWGKKWTFSSSRQPLVRRSSRLFRAFQSSICHHKSRNRRTTKNPKFWYKDYKKAWVWKKKKLNFWRGFKLKKFKRLFLIPFAYPRRIRTERSLQRCRRRLSKNYCSNKVKIALRTANSTISRKNWNPIVSPTTLTSRILSSYTVVSSPRKRSVARLSWTSKMRAFRTYLDKSTAWSESFMSSLWPLNSKKHP